MTTMAYDGKRIAIDSRMTSNGVIVSNERTKWLWSKQGLFFMCGAMDDCIKFVGEFEDNRECSDKTLNAGGFLVSNGKVFSVFEVDGKYGMSDTTGIPWADGSGRDFALAALDFGKSAEQAVKYAITRCVYTGGKVHVFDAVTVRQIK